MAGTIAPGTGLSTGQALGVLLTSPDPFRTFIETANQQKQQQAINQAAQAYTNPNLVTENGITLDRSLMSDPNLFDQAKVGAMPQAAPATRSRAALESLINSGVPGLSDKALMAAITAKPEVPNMINVFDNTTGRTTAMSENTFTQMAQTQPGRFALGGQVSQPAQPEYGKIRTYTRGDQEITEELTPNGWAVKSNAPRFAPKTGAPRVMYDENNMPVSVTPDDPAASGLSPKPYRVLTETASKSLEQLGQNYDTYERLNSTFKPDYVGKPVVGAAAIQASKMGMGDPNLGNWWADYQTMVNAVRNDQFGAALTPNEQREFEKAMITPAMTPEAAQKNLNRQIGVIQTSAARRAKGLASQGYAPRAIENFLGRSLSDLPDPMARPETKAPDTQGWSIRLKQ